MIKVDFHVLETNESAALQYVCQLVEKSYQSKQWVYIHTNSSQDAERIDDLLWSFREDSYLPHCIYDASETEQPPIQIGHGNELPSHKQTLINLSTTIPDFYAQFNHLIEIVFSDPTVQQLARERFKHYREKGCDLTTHKIKANDL